MQGTVNYESSMKQILTPIYIEVDMRQISVSHKVSIVREITKRDIKIIENYEKLYLK